MTALRQSLHQPERRIGMPVCRNAEPYDLHVFLLLRSNIYHESYHCNMQSENEKSMTIDHLTWAIWPGFQTIWYVYLHIIGRLIAPIMWFFYCRGLPLYQKSRQVFGTIVCVCGDLPFRIQLRIRHLFHPDPAVL